eukprot:XP_001707272.1 Hypothetical protein GL50803_20764 [Giardia lamblia ATCC 50803]
MDVVGINQVSILDVKVQSVCNVLQGQRKHIADLAEEVFHSSSALHICPYLALGSLNADYNHGPATLLIFKFSDQFPAQFPTQLSCGSFWRHLILSTHLLYLISNSRFRNFRISWHLAPCIRLKY